MAYLPDNPDDWPASIVTRKQRNRLQDGLDLDNAADSTMMARIRSRAQAGLLDFSLLLTTLPQSEIEKIFREPEEGSYPPIGSSIPSVLALLYLGGLERELSSSTESEGWNFAEHAELGIERALNATGVSVKNVSVDIEVDRGESFQQLGGRDPSTLPPYLLKQMLASGSMTPEEFANTLSKDATATDSASRNGESPT